LRNELERRPGKADVHAIDKLRQLLARIYRKRALRHMC